MVGQVCSTVDAAVRAVALGRQVRLERLHHLAGDLQSRGQVTCFSRIPAGSLAGRQRP